MYGGGPNFWNQRGNFASRGLLRSPDLPPPLLVNFQMMLPLRSTRIRHLRTFFKTHPRMQMPTVVGAQLQNLSAVRQQPFCDADPVAVIARQFQGRESSQDPLRIPWIRKVAQSMRLMGNRNAELSFHLQRCTIKIFRLRIAPCVRSGMTINEQGIVVEAFFNLAVSASANAPRPFPLE